MAEKRNRAEKRTCTSPATVGRARPRPLLTSVLAVLCGLLASAGPATLSAQDTQDTRFQDRGGASEAFELPIRRSIPALSGASATTCPSTAEASAPPEGGEARARDLASAATEAALLGDPVEVRDLLRQATALDPSSPDLAYRRARAHDELDETDAAIQWYCRYLALAPEEGDEPEVSARLRELGGGLGPPASETAMEAFREGVALLERGNAAAAEDRFTEALDADRGLAEARYNRGLARGSLGRSREAVVDFRAYLAARPDAPDRTEVAGAARLLERSQKRYDPIWAAALGTLVPGAGHFYTGRPVGGGILLGGAVAAGLAGALYERVEIRCRTAPENGFCPEDQIHSRTSERPGLVPGMVGVALAAAVSAVTAYRGAVDRNGESVRLRIAGHESQARDGDGLRVGPPVLAHAPGGVELRILNLRF